MKAEKSKRLAALVALWVSVGVAIAAEPRRVFDIEQQPLAAALSQFALQSDRQILFATEIVEAKRTRGIKGEWEPQAALEKLLEGTGLTFRVTAEQTILVEKASDDASKTSRTRGDVEEIVVTGTNIRGIANPTAPVQSYDRETIERSGYSSADQFIKSLPQDFRGGNSAANEDGKIAGAANSPLNHEGAVGFNLRGLGNASTLVLFNGRRMAPAAVGAFTDVSMIPLAALDRVDIVTDGSSAIYGGDAVGGVVNFITRRDYRGAETIVRYVDTARSDMHEVMASQALGNTWNSGNVVAALQ
jgi:outer membrane receptor protein involved in Fe transport